MFSLRTFCYRAATLVALASASACSSSTDKDPDPTPARGLAWSVDGGALSTTTLQSQKGSSTISVAGTATSGATVNFLALEVPNAVGTYTFSPTSASATYSTTTGSTVAVYYAGPSPGGTVTGAGTIVVTALTATNITGTFTFTGINPNTGASKSITNGTFNVGL